MEVADRLGEGREEGREEGWVGRMVSGSVSRVVAIAMENARAPCGWNGLPLRAKNSGSDPMKGLSPP